jgi:hypothetical protein
MPPCSARTAATALVACFASTGALAQDALPPLPTVEQQIAASVLALPKDLRDGAKVMGFRTRDKLEVIREGKNGMTCLALFAGQKRFHVACYQNGMEPFMARGRELRAKGVKGAEVDSVRFKEVKQGKIKMPKQAIMYQLFGDSTAWNPATGAVTGASELLVLYMPGATTESTGLSAVPSEKGPWMMFPGTPKAHMMLQGSMTP